MFNTSVIMFIVTIIASGFWLYMTAAIWLYSRLSTIAKLILSFLFAECLIIMWVVH